MENVLATLALSGGSSLPSVASLPLDHSAFYEALCSAVLGPGSATDQTLQQLISPFLLDALHPMLPPLLPASLVGKAAFSYAQAVAIKRISTFLQSTLEGSTSKPAPSSSSSSAESHSTSTAPSPSRTTTEQQNQQTMLMQQMNDRLETLRRLNGLLELKSTILKPAMDLCEWAASRGHSLLAGVMALSRDLQSSLDDLGRTVTALNLNVPDIPAIDAAITSFTAVLSQIDALVPFVQMALQIAGIQFGNRIDSSAISPVLLMRASNALSSVRASKSNTLGNPDSRFRVKMYTLFEGSARSKSAVDWTWKEEFAKAIAYMQFHKEQGLYTLCVDQDLNDERFHDDRDVLKIPIDPELGIRVGDRVRVQVRDISRLFYTNSGRLLNIEDARMPVLVLRVDERERDDSDPSVNAADPANPFSDAPKTPVNRSADPSKRVVRWIALELYDDSRSDSDDDDDDHDAGDDSASELQTTDAQTEPESLDSGPDADTESKTESNAETTTALESLTSKVGNLQLTPKRDPLRLKSDQSTPITPLQWYTPGYFQSPGPSPASTHHQQQRQVHPHPSSTLTTQQPLYTLCILEFMLRLASLEQLEGISHLHIPDEKVCFFLLNEAGTAGKAHSNLASSSASKLEYDGTGNIEHLATAQNQVISAVGGVGARIGALGAVNDRSMSVPIHGNTSSRAKGKLRHHHQVTDPADLESPVRVGVRTPAPKRFIDKLTANIKEHENKRDCALLGDIKLTGLAWQSRTLSRVYVYGQEQQLRNSPQRLITLQLTPRSMRTRETVHFLGDI